MMEPEEIEMINDRCRYLECYGISGVSEDFKRAFQIVERYYIELEPDEGGRSFVDVNELFEHVAERTAGADLTRALRPSDVAQMMATIAEQRDRAESRFICGVLVLFTHKT